MFVSLRMAASAMAPSAPMLFRSRLRARGRVGNGERVGVSMGADTNQHSRAGSSAGRPLERLQCRVALEALSKSCSSLGTEFVHIETASMGAEAGAESVNGR